MANSPQAIGNGNGNLPKKDQIPAPSEGSFLLGSLTHTDITGTKMKSVTFPNGSIAEVTTWHELKIQVAHYALGHGKLVSVPFYTSSRSKSPLLAKVESPESKLMRVPNELPAPFSDWLVEGHQSAAGHQHNCQTLLLAAGLDPGTFKIVVKRNSA